MLMAVVIKEGNVFDSDADIICHQVNCQGVMGSGVAKEVRERYPAVYEQYRDLCERCMNDPAQNLGVAQLVPVDEEGSRWIANCFGQEDFGYNGKQYTSIDALTKALSTVADIARAGNLKVAMPYKIGCVRGGANWDTVKKNIDAAFQGVDVELWKL
jgi:O-acetyl-ADP-ribose deacetylase (regulator of RNase III)